MSHKEDLVAARKECQRLRQLVRDLVSCLDHAVNEIPLRSPTDQDALLAAWVEEARGLIAKVEGQE